MGQSEQNRFDRRQKQREIRAISKDTFLLKQRKRCLKALIKLVSSVKLIRSTPSESWLYKCNTFTYNSSLWSRNSLASSYTIWSLRMQSEKGILEMLYRPGVFVYCKMFPVRVAKKDTTASHDFGIASWLLGSRHLGVIILNL